MLWCSEGRRRGGCLGAADQEGLGGEEGRKQSNSLFGGGFGRVLASRNFMSGRRLLSLRSSPRFSVASRLTKLSPFTSLQHSPSSLSPSLLIAPPIPTTPPAE